MEATVYKNILEFKLQLPCYFGLGYREGSLHVHIHDAPWSFVMFMGIWADIAVPHFARTTPFLKHVCINHQRINNPTKIYKLDYKTWCFVQCVILP